MKTLTKLFMPVVLLVVTLTGLKAANEQRPGPGPREDARYVIHHTRIVIEQGQKIVTRGHVYTGDLSRAISHQHLAVRLFNQGMFARAINQSVRARQLAFAAIRANKGEIKAEWQFEDREQPYVKSAPADADLDKETVSVDANLKDEKAATSVYGDLDVEVKVEGK